VPWSVKTIASVKRSLGATSNALSVQDSEKIILADNERYIDILKILFII
jgi:hypothetical protein